MKIRRINLKPGEVLEVRDATSGCTPIVRVHLDPGGEWINVQHITESRSVRWDADAVFEINRALGLAGLMGMHTGDD